VTGADGGALWVEAAAPDELWTLVAVSDDEERRAAVRNPRVWLVSPGSQASERWAGVDD
jgi:hypothetical protein